MKPVDVIIVGGGLCGIIFLKYAREYGLNCLLLEKQKEVGGLWNWQPMWQDIQNRKEDFAINQIPLKGVNQPEVVQYIRDWVHRYNLNPFIRTQHKVTSVSWKEEGWQVKTNQKTFCAEFVIVASGVQNAPWIPEVNKCESDIREVHSSNLHRPSDLEGEKVTVVGGGTSSWDLLDLALENNAKDIQWVHRSIQWLLPTSGSKQNAWPNLRELAAIQVIVSSAKKVNNFLRWLLNKLYNFHNLQTLQPEKPFDIQKHQLIPARALMTQNLEKISRHHSEISNIANRTVTLKNGESFETDMILWGTGYRMNLTYLGLPEYRHVTTLNELRPKLGSLIRSNDYPNLFFIGMTLIDSTSSTPFFTAIESKTIIAHILGKCEIPQTKIEHCIAHWDLVRHFAQFDHYNYPKFWWKIKYFLLALWYLIFRNRRLKI